MTIRVSKDRIDMDDKVLQKPVLKDYGETVVTANSSTAYTIDLTTGNVFNITLTGNCAFTFSNPPASGTAGSFSLRLTQDGTGGRTTTWPAAVRWQGGVAPTLMSRPASVDMFSFLTVNGGTTWYGFHAATRAATIGTVAFRSSATSSTNSITIPAGVQTGDVAFLFEFGSSGLDANSMWLSPPGWTTIIGYAAGLTESLNSIDDTNYYLQIHYKKMTATDASTAVTSVDATSDRKVMLVFSGKIDDVKIGTINNSGYTGANPASQTVTVSSAATPLIVFGVALDADLSGNGAFSTASPAFDGTITSALHVGYKIYNSSPSNHTIDMNDLGTNWLLSFHALLS